MDTTLLLLGGLKDALATVVGVFLTWPMWGIVAALLIMRFGPELYDHWRLGRARLLEVDLMTGLEFEKFLQYLFERQGYKVERTPRVGDYGADLILSREGVRTLVQAKRWSKNVGPKAVQEAAAGRPHYWCDRAIVVVCSIH